MPEITAKSARFIGQHQHTDDQIVDSETGALAIAPLSAGIVAALEAAPTPLSGANPAASVADAALDAILNRSDAGGLDITNIGELARSTADYAIKVTIDAADPGAIGAGNIWLRVVDVSLLDGNPITTGSGYAIRVRNAADDGWLIPTHVMLDGLGNVRGVVREDVTGGGETYEVQSFDASANWRNDISVYDGGMELNHKAVGSVGWDAQVLVGEASGSEAGVMVTAGGATDSGSVVIDATGIGLGGTADGNRVGFYGGTPIAQPVIPATPNAQDIADVLVALGLATQAAP